MKLSLYADAAALNGTERVLGLQSGNERLIAVSDIAGAAAELAEVATAASAAAAAASAATAAGLAASIPAAVIAAVGPGTHFEAVALSDTVNINNGPHRELYVGTTPGGGDAIVTIMAADGTTAPFTVGQGDSIDVVSFIRVKVTGTTAGVADLVAIK